MRIIGGTASGRRLRAPRGLATRPTLDRVKQSLFDILAGRVEGARVLDLYAGSGTLGIEAISRGAMFVAFVDLSTEAIKVIKENLASCGFEEKAEVYRNDVGRALAVLEKRGATFDIIFIDPPYGRGLADKTLLTVGASKLLAVNVLVIVRHRHKEDIPADAGALRLVRREYYGESTLSFFESKAGNDLEGGSVSREL